MSRTHHKRWPRCATTSTRRSSRPSLTRGHWSYSASVFDYHEGNGGQGWERWLADWNGYRKQRKRRENRKYMKRLGRKRERQQRRLALQNEDW